MGKLDVNLEGYRIVADILHRLRRFIRDYLREIHGDGWERLGLDGAKWGHLKDRRDREGLVSWRLPEGCDILDFAGFADLLDIAGTEDATLRHLSTLVPSPELLRARFLELDVVFNRIAYARPISESELEFLVSFGDRIRKALLEPMSGAQAPPTGEMPQTRISPHPGGGVDASPSPLEKTAGPIAAGTPLQQQPPSEPPATRGAAPDRVPADELGSALASGASQRVLAALYQEITDVADTLWRSGSVAEPPVWSVVRESSWYRQQFSALGMKVVSDFYDLVQRCRERSGDGPDSDVAQEFLKENNFAQLLLSLRDFFKSQLSRDRNGQ